MRNTKPTQPPEGFLYEEDLISPDEETALVRQIEKLPLKEFEFHGYTGKRRVVSFGWRYDFVDASFGRVGDIPEFLRSVRAKAAAFAGLPADAFPHILVTEYSPGAPIGWHRDKAVFDDVVGVSLLSPCTFRVRRESGTGWQRHTLTLAPRSAYLLRGLARTDWEHSIPAVDALRYSITFRCLRQ